MSRHHAPLPPLPFVAVWRDVLKTMPRVFTGAGGVLLVWAGLAVVSALLPAQGGLALALIVGLILVGLAAVGAVARIGLSDDMADARSLGLGPAGFQFGRAEARLLWAGLLCLLFLAMVLVVVVLVLLALFGIAELDAEAITRRDWSEVGSGWKLGVLALVGLGGVAIPVMLAARLAMFIPVTVAQGQAVSLPAMVISRGNVAKMVGGLVVAAMPTVVVVATGVSALVILTATLVQIPSSVVFLCKAYQRLNDGDSTPRTRNVR